MKNQKIIAALLLALTLGACANTSQNTYNAAEVGKATTVTFGTILGARQVDIKGENTGLGAIGGAAVGAGVGTEFGQGTGNAWATGLGAVAGLAAGALAEQELADRKGIEYTLTLESGETLTIVQEQAPTDRVFSAGERVMVQSNCPAMTEKARNDMETTWLARCDGYQRILPASHLPDTIKRPKGVKVVD